MTNQNSPFLSDEMLLDEFETSIEWMNEVEEPNYEFENDYHQENESPFLFEDRQTDFWNPSQSRSQNEFELDQEMVEQLMYELHDHEFSKAIYDVASEIRARVNTPFLLNEFDYKQNNSPNAIAERYLSPLQMQTEGYFNHLMSNADERDVRNYSNYEIENLLDNYAFEGELDDKQEYFFKKFKEKAKKVIAKVKKVAKKVGKFLPMKLILKGLSKIVMPLIQKMIQLGISKLPAPVRPIAVELADKLFKKAKKKVADFTGEEDTESDGNNVFADDSVNNSESTENQSSTEETTDISETQIDPEAVQSADTIQEEINGAFIQSLMGYETQQTTENFFFEGETYENEFFEGEFEEETDIESARQNFIYELSNLEKGESPEPAIQNFLPVVMKFAKPAIKLALKFIGREKIVDIVAKLAAKLISKFIGEEKALTLSRHLVDAGFKKFLNFEIEDATPNAEIAYEVIVDVVQEVARRVSNLPEEALMNEELLTRETNIAFEQAARAIFPDNLIRHETREAQNTNGVWQSVQMPNGSRKYRKYSQIFDVNLDKNRLKYIRTFGGERLTDFLTNKMGVSINGQNARVHLYEAMPDCMLSEIAINETAIPSLGTSGEESYGQIQPLTPVAAAVLLNEIGLASDDDDKYLQNRHTIREGQRFYVLEMEGVGRMSLMQGEMFEGEAIESIRFKNSGDYYYNFATFLNPDDCKILKNYFIKDDKMALAKIINLSNGKWAFYDQVTKQSKSVFTIEMQKFFKYKIPSIIAGLSASKDKIIQAMNKSSNQGITVYCTMKEEFDNSRPCAVAINKGNTLKYYREEKKGVVGSTLNKPAINNNPKFLLGSRNVNEKQKNKTKIFIHHTAGNHSPEDTIIDWQKNPKKIGVGTAYVIGGIGLNDIKFNGKIYQCFNDKFSSGHLGLKQKDISNLKQNFPSLKNLEINDEKIKVLSIGIEICNWGILTKKGDKFYNYAGNVEIPQSQVHDYGENSKFRNGRYYHKYTNEQIASLKELLVYLSKLHNIPINKFWSRTTFEIMPDAFDLSIKGLFTHTNVRVDKSDCHPYPPLIQMLNSL